MVGICPWWAFAHSEILITSATGKTPGDMLTATGPTATRLPSVDAFSRLAGGFALSIMLTYVSEGTKEIGRRSVVGSRRRNILSPFVEKPRDEAQWAWSASAFPMPLPGTPLPFLTP